MRMQNLGGTNKEYYGIFRNGLLSLSSLPHFQAEYLIYRKWPIKIPVRPLNSQDVG